MNKQITPQPHNEELVKAKLEELKKRSVDKWKSDKKGTCVHFIDELFQSGKAYTYTQLYAALEKKFSSIKDGLGEECKSILKDYEDMRAQLYRDAYSAILKSSIDQIKKKAARSGEFVTPDTEGNDTDTYFYKTPGFSCYQPKPGKKDYNEQIRREIVRIQDNFYAFGNKTKSSIAKIQSIIKKSDSTELELYKNISNELASVSTLIETQDTIKELRNYSYIISFTQDLKNQTVQKELIAQITIINQMLKDKPKGWGADCEQRYKYTIEIAREIDDKVVFANFAVKFAEFAIFYQSLKPTAIKLYCEAIEIYKNHIESTRNIESISYLMQMHNRLTYMYLKTKQYNEAIISAQDASATVYRVRTLMEDRYYPEELSLAIYLAARIGDISTTAPRDRAIYGMKSLLDSHNIPEDITLKALK